MKRIIREFVNNVLWGIKAGFNQTLILNIRSKGKICLI